jgi:hypothetical protein
MSAGNCTTGGADPQIPPRPDHPVPWRRPRPAQAARDREGVPEHRDGSRRAHRGSRGFGPGSRGRAAGIGASIIGIIGFRSEIRGFMAEAACFMPKAPCFGTEATCFMPEAACFMGKAANFMVAAASFMPEAGCCRAEVGGFTSEVGDSGTEAAARGRCRGLHVPSGPLLPSSARHRGSARWIPPGASRTPRLDSTAPHLLEIAPLGTARSQAQVAQLVEHVTENHGVTGSIPVLGTTPSPTRNE